MDTRPDSAEPNLLGGSEQPWLAPLLVPDQGRGAALSAATQTCVLQVMGPSSSQLRLLGEIDADRCWGMARPEGRGLSTGPHSSAGHEVERGEEGEIDPSGRKMSCSPSIPATWYSIKDSQL